MKVYGTLVITSKGTTNWVETSRSTKPISRKSATQNEQNGISPTLDGVDTIQPARSFFAYGDTRFQPRKDSTDRRPDKKLSSQPLPGKTTPLAGKKIGPSPSQGQTSARHNQWHRHVTRGPPPTTPLGGWSPQAPTTAREARN